MLGFFFIKYISRKNESVSIFQRFIFAWILTSWLGSGRVVQIWYFIVCKTRISIIITKKCISCKWLKNKMENQVSSSFVQNIWEIAPKVRCLISISKVSVPLSRKDSKGFVFQIGSFDNPIEFLNLLVPVRNINVDCKE